MSLEEILGFPLYWHCHICGEYRRDDKIRVYTTDISAEHGQPLGTIIQHVRYCEDKPGCVVKAQTHRLFKGKRMSKDDRNKEIIRRLDAMGEIVAELRAEQARILAKLDEVLRVLQPEPPARPVINPHLEAIIKEREPNPLQGDQSQSSVIR